MYGWCGKRASTRRCLPLPEWRTPRALRSNCPASTRGNGIPSSWGRACLRAACRPARHDAWRGRFPAGRPAGGGSIMTRLAEWLNDRLFPGEHPYRIYEQEVARLLKPDHTLLDAGCGRTAPILSRFKGRAGKLIGVDLGDFTGAPEGLELHTCDLGKMPLADESVDLAMARSVMEHVVDPDQVYREIHRVLKPGGQFVFLTANLWDYASIIALIVPNRFHPWIVARTEGRDESDTFPVAYRTNTRRAVERWAGRAGLEVVSFR